MTLDFAVVDVETANENFTSICSIGLAQFRGGKLVSEAYTLINPETHFSNSFIHGISQSDVNNAPKLLEGLQLLNAWLSEDLSRTVCHMPFDRTATTKAAEKVGLEWSHIKWHDSARAVKLGWSEYRQRGYGLGKISKVLGIEFEHHNALADAKAAGFVLLEAAKRIDISQATLWDQISLDNATRSRSAYLERQKEKPVANPEGPFFGQGICFTGALPNMTRKKASSVAAALGFEVLSGVTGKCHLLVTGELDETQLVEGEKKSSKWRKAESMIMKGSEVRIMGPSDFEALST